jgi:uncharacterized protein (DUF305 family)
MATAATAVVLGLTLTACSSSATPAASGASVSATSGTAQPGVVFADADVTFLQQMYPHHAQAVEMAKLVDGRTTTPAVVQLATMIQGEQSPEMTTMTTLLSSFGKPASSSSMDMSGMSGMDSSSAQGMPGMMSASDMSTLGGLTGTAFDQKWLTMMTAHHQGAITMATTELSAGTNPDAQKLATGIISAQKAEIATMATLLH